MVDSLSGEEARRFRLELLGILAVGNGAVFISGLGLGHDEAMNSSGQAMRNAVRNAVRNEVENEVLDDLWCLSSEIELSAALAINREIKSASQIAYISCLSAINERKKIIERVDVGEKYNKQHD